MPSPVRAWIFIIICGLLCFSWKILKVSEKKKKTFSTGGNNNNNIVYKVLFSDLKYDFSYCCCVYKMRTMIVKTFFYFVVDFFFLPHGKLHSLLILLLILLSILWLSIQLIIIIIIFEKKKCHILKFETWNICMYIYFFPFLFFAYTERVVFFIFVTLFLTVGDEQFNI